MTSATPPKPARPPKPPRALKLPRTARAAIAALSAAAALALADRQSAAQTDQVIASDGQITGKVVFWHAYNADSPEAGTLEQELIPGFVQAHPGVTVESVPIP